MFDVPVESTYVWFGLAIVSAGLLGFTLRVPTAPPPDATPVVRTVDSVASSPYEATARHPIDASQIRLGPERLGLRGPGGEAHAAYAYDSVFPATRNDRLRAVLRGEPPDEVFADVEAFVDALDRRETHRPWWQPAPETLIVRRVSWEGTNATLVGA